MQVERLVVVLEGNVAQLRAAMKQGELSLAGVDAAAGKTQVRIEKVSKASKDATPSVSAFRGSLTALLASTLKLPGPLTNVTSLLGTLAFGTTTTVAIVGGLAAIAAGYKLIGKEADTAGKLVQGAREDLLKDATIRGFGPGGISAAAAREAQTNIARLTRERMRLPTSGSQEEMFFAGRMRASIDRQILENAAVVREAGLQAAEALAKEKDEIEKTGKAAEKAVPRLRTLKDAVRDLKRELETRLNDRWLEFLTSGGTAVGGRYIGGIQPVAQNMPQPNLLPFGPRLTAQAPQGDGSTFTLGVSRFRDAVDGFRDGVKSFFEGFTDFKAIGSQLAGMGVGMLAGKLFEDLKGALESDNSAQDRLTAALEKNTKALQVSSEFLRARFGAATAAAGLDPTALAGIQETIRNVLDRVLVGDIKGDPFGGLAGPTLNEAIREALSAGGLTPEVLAAIAKGLGLDVSVLSPEVLGQMLDGFAAAGVAANDLAQSFQEVLRNVPEGFKATLDYLRFRATDAVDRGPGTIPVVGSTPPGTGRGRDRFAGGVSLPNATFHVYGVQNVKQLLAEIEDAALGKASRGGAVTIQPAYLRR